MAGRETGRIARFLPEAEGSGRSASERRAARAEAFTRLQILMSDPAYAALYRQTQSKLNAAQSRLDAARDKVANLRADAQDALEDTLDRAAQTPDGRRVFRDADGVVRYASGEKVEEDVAATILWRGNEPGYQEYLARRDRVQRLDDLAADIDAGQAEIGASQNRLDSDRDPPSADDLADIGNRADAIVDDIENRLAKEISAPAPTPMEHSQDVDRVSDISVPKL